MTDETSAPYQLENATFCLYDHKAKGVAFMLENWRVVVGFPGYEVSDLGRLRSVDRIAPRVLPNGATGMSLRGRILPGRVRRNGSRPVAVLFNLYRGGKMYQTVRLHRLVLEAFVGQCPAGMEGCHNDGDPTNNRLSNLRWDTYQSNRADMVRHGTRVNPPVHFGLNHHNATLSFDQVQEIRTSYTGLRGENVALARRFGVSHQTIRRIVRGKTRVSA